MFRISLAMLAIVALFVSSVRADDEPRVIPGAVVGTVATLTADGPRPVPNAAVRIVNAHGEVVARTETNERGHFAVRGLRPGLYVATASHDRVGRGRTGFGVRGGQVKRIRIHIE